MPTLALIGANGHGMWHRRIIAPLHGSGRLRLVGLSDVRPIEASHVPVGAAVEPDLESRRREQ